ncbi:hypothetical protein PV963_24260 [Streptomyces coeruleorubidus]|uniref:hypothetical protein n=1 Tax=Streptomyces coeruleorubidus TaxID=116188 RepID=UPI00237EFB4E|nr:hypothetical protein [Streptomyces coeruleorubidus]WDV57082.1 hypothetical protein PV963_24260 [Streptomyces coeruleorubidus]
MLAEFGKVEYDRGISYGQCDIQLHGPDDWSVSVFVDLQAGPSDVSVGGPAPTPVLRGGTTVYESESYGGLTGDKDCTRDVVVREGSAAVAIGVNDDAHQWGSIGGVGVIAGDPDTYGRVYVGTNGRGLQYGDPS